MQVNGMNEFFSRVASLNGIAGNRPKSFLSALIPQGQAGYDSLFLSDMGKRLSLSMNKASLPDETQKINEINNPTLKLVDKYLAQLEGILERMHELATIAQDKDITDLDRVNMQIEFEELRQDIVVVQRNMSLESQGEPITMERLTNPLMEGLDSPYFRGDGTNILERMRNRIMNGEEWNVREAFGDGTWRVVEDNNKNLFTKKIQGDLVVGVDTGKLVPTVREELELLCPVVLMDAESAADGAELIEKHIKEVQRLRVNFAEYSALMEKEPTKGPSSDEVLHLASQYFENHPLRLLYGLSTTPGYLILGRDGEVYDRNLLFMGLSDKRDDA